MAEPRRAARFAPLGLAAILAAAAGPGCSQPIAAAQVTGAPAAERPAAGPSVRPATGIGSGGSAPAMGDEAVLRRRLAALDPRRPADALRLIEAYGGIAAPRSFVETAAFAR